VTDTPAIELEAPSLDDGTPMGKAARRWLREEPRTLAEALDVGITALKDADVPWTVRRRARRTAHDYFLDDLGLSPAEPLIRGALPTGPPMPEPLYEPLAGLMNAVADRDYDTLAGASAGRLNPDAIRRRLEEDYTGPLALPPREHYAEAAFVGDPVEEGFVLDLWTGDAIADLHLTGFLERRVGGGYHALLTDILP
jgi:phosphoglycolate phosphatase-like HAD superfamily hydrolase